MLLPTLSASGASIPQNPREVIEESKFGDRVLWLGQFAFVKRTETSKGEHLVTGVFHYLKAKVASYEQLQFPLIASETNNGLFSVGIVLKKERLNSAIQIEKNYGEMTPFILVKGTTERVMNIDGNSIVRIQVEDAWPIEQSKINVISNTSFKRDLLKPAP